MTLDDYRAENYTSVFHDIAPHILDEFVPYHRDNPGIYDLFRRFAFELRTSGRRHYGAKALMERIRWHVEIERSGEFKVNNSFVSCYTRLLQLEYPDFKTFFQTRKTSGTVEVSK